MYFEYTLFHNLWQSTVAFNLAHNKNIPAIFLCKEYTSSGGGISLCFTMTGTRLWIFWVVFCEPKSNGVSFENGSPSTITASTWASFITYISKIHATTCADVQPQLFAYGNKNSMNPFNNRLWRFVSLFNPPLHLELASYNSLISSHLTMNNMNNWPNKFLCNIIERCKHTQSFESHLIAGAYNQENKTQNW